MVIGCHLTTRIAGKIPERRAHFCLQDAAVKGFLSSASETTETMFQLGYLTSKTGYFLSMIWSLEGLSFEIMVVHSLGSSCPNWGRESSRMTSSRYAAVE